MMLLNKARLLNFVERMAPGKHYAVQHPDYELLKMAVAGWIAAIEKTDWRTEDVKTAAPRADYSAAPHHVGFRVGGGTYLIRCAVGLDAGEVDVLCIGRANVPEPRPSARMPHRRPRGSTGRLF